MVGGGFSQEVSEDGRAEPAEVSEDKGSRQKDQHGRGHIRECECLDSLKSIIKCGFSG